VIAGTVTVIAGTGGSVGTLGVLTSGTLCVGEMSGMSGGLTGTGALLCGMMPGTLNMESVGTSLVPTRYSKYNQTRQVIPMASPTLNGGAAPLFSLHSPSVLFFMLPSYFTVLVCNT